MLVRPGQLYDKPARILIAGSDVDIVPRLQEVLEQEEFDVTVADTAENAVEWASMEAANLLILVGWPRTATELEVYTQLPAVLVLIVADFKSEEGIAKALDWGADDCCDVPISDAILVARIRALLRRHPRQRTVKESLEFGDLLINFSRRQVFKKGARISLTRTEFDVLSCLIKSPDAVVPAKAILAKVWGGNPWPSEDAVKMHVYHIRHKIEPPRYIRREHGRGWVMTSRVSIGRGRF